MPGVAGAGGGAFSTALTLGRTTLIWAVRRRLAIRSGMAVGDSFERIHTNRPLLAGLEQAGDQLLPIESFPTAVLLDDHIRDLVHPFVRREPTAALQALPTPADDLALAALAGIHHLVAKVSAVRAFHRASPSAAAVAIFRMLPKSSPS